MLRARLAGGPLGDPLIYLPTIGSTNSHAAELARDGAHDGTLVLTDAQPEGRGRVGRRWRSMPRQQLLFSLVLRPAFPAHFLVMAAALAVADAIDAVAGVPVAIKWPNDVLFEGRKLCGILIETGTGAAGAYAVLGIGLNINGSLEGDP
ncbi:MAG TPA: biotin--[acetyl-CoA-carboxylase] ligase, partial [Ktedonobacterales bacterium]|nr:biotin--[acetyl-CoA-carboxylase] ligase [Ktedonobacterales bacterium]